MKRRTRKVVLATFAFALALAITAAVYFRPRPGYARALFDAGPFRGEQRTNCPREHPAQRFAPGSGYTLEVFDPVDSFAPPLVALRDPSDHERWCVAAAGTPGTRVRSLRFLREERDRRGRPVLRAEVVWDFGPEMSRWYLDRDFRLLEYWYAR
jgi:hypothetical protein